MAQLAPQQDLYSGTQDFTGTPNTTGGINNDPMDSTTTGMVGIGETDPTTGTPVQETQTIAETTEPRREQSARSLNANELNALSAANDVANSALSIAGGSSTQSLTNGLSTQQNSIADSTAGGMAGDTGSADGQNTGASGGSGMDLAQGGSVQTEDITGEDSLAQS